MPYAQDTGYTPSSIETILDSLRVNINAQFGTTYTTESFIGTSFYKYFYALAQDLQKSDIKASEIFLKLQGYFEEINAMISRPVNTNPGIVEKMKDEGYIASVKPPNNTDAGKIFICVDVDETDPDYADMKLAICTLISQITAAGNPTQGTEVETIVLTNGQAFDFKYDLPNRIPVKLRLTIAVSENNQLAIGDPDDTKLLLLQNIRSRYQLGKNFEPQRYFAISDAPWAGSVLLEWAEDDGVLDWSDDVYDAAYDDLFDFDLADIELVET